MSVKFDDLAAQRDPLYAATLPVGEFDEAREEERLAAHRQRRGDTAQAWQHREYRNAALLRLTIRALRNQGEPYYTQEVTPGD